MRGIANLELTAELGCVLRAGGGIPSSLSDRLLSVAILADPGEMLSLALQAGFQSAGIDTVDVGVMTSGGISHLTAVTGATMGAVVSASHNPAADNGIKFLSANGSKLTDAEEDSIEAVVRSSKCPHPDRFGSGHPISGLESVPALHRLPGFDRPLQPPRPQSRHRCCQRSGIQGSTGGVWEVASQRRSLGGRTRRQQHQSQLRVKLSRVPGDSGGWTDRPGI